MSIESSIGDREESMTTDQGKIPVETVYKIWYRRLGSAGLPPLILHEGDSDESCRLLRIWQTFNDRRVGG
jgi:hypothetical protein